MHQLHKTWHRFVETLANHQMMVQQQKPQRAIFITDAGGLVHGLPQGVYQAQSSQEVAHILKTAQQYKIPITTRGGGLTTEGESVATGGLLLDMSGLNQVLHIDATGLKVRTQAGIFWHSLAEMLRPQGLDYLSAPLNLTSSVGGTLGVGGIDINSCQLGCSADQVAALQVVTPTGEIIECSQQQHSELFNHVLLGYGQFGVITEATLHIRPFQPMIMRYLYYPCLQQSITDLMTLIQAQAIDSCGILTLNDRAINLMLGFDSEDKLQIFQQQWQPRLAGHGELGFSIRTAGYYALRPWKFNEAFYMLKRKQQLFPELHRPEYHNAQGQVLDRSVLYSRAVWNFWGGRQMAIPDLACNADKLIQVVTLGNKICQRYFRYYSLYCVGIRLFDQPQRYELSCIPNNATDYAYGCEFDPILAGKTYSRDYLQSFKNEIYDLGLNLQTSYYRFGGSMKSYIRRAFGDELVNQHLAYKKQLDPNMILNAHVIF